MNIDRLHLRHEATYRAGHAEFEAETAEGWLVSAFRWMVHYYDVKYGGRDDFLAARNSLEAALLALEKARHLADAAEDFAKQPDAPKGSTRTIRKARREIERVSALVNAAVRGWALRAKVESPSNSLRPVRDPETHERDRVWLQELIEALTELPIPERVKSEHEPGKLVELRKLIVDTVHKWDRSY